MRVIRYLAPLLALAASAGLGRSLSFSGAQSMAP